MLSPCQRLSGTDQSVLKQKVTSFASANGRDHSLGVERGDGEHSHHFRRKRDGNYEKKAAFRHERDEMGVGAIPARWTSGKLSGLSVPHAVQKHTVRSGYDRTGGSRRFLRLLWRAV